MVNFLVNMSHEIRTPINGIMGMLQLMQTTELSEEQDQYVKMATDSSKRLQRLLSDILDLSKIEADKMEIREEQFNLSEITQSIEDIFRQVTKQNKNALHIYLDDNIPEILVGDSSRLTQILFNLVGNATKYTQNGEINFHASLITTTGQDICRVLFTIEDTGEGIADDQLNSIFDAFTQANDSGSPYTRKYEGAGLGLPLVKRLVNLMNGNASIVSQEGEGTSVYVVLPFKIPGSFHVGDQLPERESVGTNGVKVLLADDDPTTQSHIKNLLEKTGNEVITVDNGEDALAKLKEEKYDCILMDVQMPVMDGVVATKRIRELEAGGSNFKIESGKPDAGKEKVVPESPNSSMPELPNPRIPIIALTAYTMSGDREKFLEAGMDDYIAKPVDKDELLEVIERNLQRD